MNEQLFGAAIGIVTTIIGGIFGYLMSEISTRRREARETKSRAAAIRLIVGMEIDRNLSALGKQWNAVKQCDSDPTDTGDRRKTTLAHCFTETPLLPFSRDSFKSQLPLLPGALPRETISAIFQAYDVCSTIESIRAELADALADQQSEMAKFRSSATPPGQAPGIVYAPRKPFDGKATQVWNEIETLIKAALQAGNPLQEVTKR